MSRLAQHSYNLAIESHLIDTTRKCIGAVDVLRWTWGDAQSPRRSGLHSSARVGTRTRAHPRLRICGFRYVDFHFTKEGPVGVEHLYATVAAIRNIDIARRIGRNAVR